MDSLIQIILGEIRRVFIDRMVNELFGDMTRRDFTFFVLGVICTLLMLEVRDMATLTSAQQVRLGIQDQPMVARDVYSADGVSTGYQIPHLNVTTASAYVQVGGEWSATGAVFASGEVAFADRVSANSAYQLHYTYSVFSDDEIDHMLSAGGNINGARLEAVQTLMFVSQSRSQA